MSSLHYVRAWNLQQEQIFLHKQLQHFIINPTTNPSQYITVYDKNANSIQEKKSKKPEFSAKNYNYN